MAYLSLEKNRSLHATVYLAKQSFTPCGHLAVKCVQMCPLPLGWSIKNPLGDLLPPNWFKPSSNLKHLKVYFQNSQISWHNLILDDYIVNHHELMVTKIVIIWLGTGYFSELVVAWAVLSAPLIVHHFLYHLDKPHFTSYDLMVLKFRSFSCWAFQNVDNWTFSHPCNTLKLNQILGPFCKIILTEIRVGRWDKHTSHCLQTESMAEEICLAI